MRLERDSMSVLLMGVLVTTVIGKPLEDHSFVHVLSGHTLILPCNRDVSDTYSGYMTVEWMWKLNDLELVVLTVRNGEELVRDKDSKYANRSSALEDGKLKLIGVTQQDAGHYRCIRRSESARKELLVHVTICESSAVDMGVLRSAENDLFVTCVSTGWIPKTLISLLNHHGEVLTDKMEEGIGPDGCQSVSVSLNLTTQESFRNGTIICSVASPGSTLVKTNKMAFTGFVLRSSHQLVFQTEPTCTPHVLQTS
ncbi:butyrophilin subfamily 3 member A1-like [Synchiropus picturatus]